MLVDVVVRVLCNVSPIGSSVSTFMIIKLKAFRNALLIKGCNIFPFSVYSQRLNDADYAEVINSGTNFHSCFSVPQSFSYAIKACIIKTFRCNCTRVAHYCATFQTLNLLELSKSIHLFAVLSRQSSFSLSVVVNGESTFRLPLSFYVCLYGSQNSRPAISPPHRRGNSTRNSALLRSQRPEIYHQGPACTPSL